MKTSFYNSPALPNASLRHSSFVIRHLLGACALAPLLALAAPDKNSAADIAPQPADNAPLAFPLLEHYSKLWENSMFTTKSLPPPDDAPKGPIFTDNLSLAGIYEVDGGVVGVLLDKVTSQIMEVRVGDENEAGIKIVRVSPGGAPDKARLQLQKGDQVGWVTFATEAAPPPEQAAPGTVGNPANGPGGVPAVNGAQSQPVGSAIPGRPIIPAAGTIPGGMIPPAGGGVIPGSAVQPNRPAGNNPRSIPGVPQARATATPPNPILPAVPASAAASAPPANDDIPLPPQ